MRDASSEPVGLVGIGLIGSAIARRLLGAGISVLGYDIDDAKRASLCELGGAAAASLAEVGARCQRVILAVFDTGQVEAALEGSDGLLAAGGPPGKIFVSVSTCDPDRMAALGERVSARGATLLEAPLSGTSDQVARGDAVALVAGDPAQIGAIEAILAAIAKRHYVLGRLGNGNRAKLAVNLILGLNRAALAEGLVFAEHLGLPLDAFLEVARGSAAYSQVMDVKGGKMVVRDYAPHGRIAQSYKDFSLILGAAPRLPFAALYRAMMQDCIDHGEADLDNAAVIAAIHRRIHVETSAGGS
jgi:3-hydroxyisobutyrate dehydrogenase-like beta-hydroxyacid dehydrogenase